MGANEISLLYSKQLLVKIKNDDSLERHVRFAVAIELHSVSLIRKHLIVRLTEENDGFLLYTLMLSEDDFQCLKTQQGLLVDFHSFPQKFIDLLECCHREEAQKLPKFILRFFPANHSYNSEGILEIIETNSFKHLIHLSLKFQQGTDADVKNYLLSCLKSLQDTKNSLEKQLKTTEATLNCRTVEFQEQLASRTSDFQRQKLEWKEEKTELNNRFSLEISKERERTSQIQNELLTRYENEKREIEQLWKKRIEHLEDKLSSVQFENKEMNEKRQQLDSLNGSLKSQLSLAADDIKYKAQELDNLGQENKSLRRQIQEREVQIHSLSTQKAVLEQEVKNMESLKIHQQTIIDNAKEQKQHLEALLEEKQQQLQKLESSNKVYAQELKKANCFINNLQAEFKNTLSKLKVRSQIAVEQEKVIGEKNEEIKKLTEELSNVNQSLTQKENEIKTLNSKLESNEEKLKENERLHHEVNWLQNQLTKKQLSENKAFTKLGGSQGMFNLNSENQRNIGIPVASSTPQMFGYLGNRIPALKNSVGGLALSTNTNKDKENEPPLDPKYLQPSGIPLKKLVSCNGVSQQRLQGPQMKGKKNIGTIQGKTPFNSAQAAEGKRHVAGSSTASAYFPDKGVT